MARLRWHWASIVSWWVLAGIGAVGEMPPNWGRRQPVDFTVLPQRFAHPDMAYAPFMFWFWDEPLDPLKMAEMARGLIAHAAEVWINEQSCGIRC